jgi:hypothetical protein
MSYDNPDLLHVPGDKCLIKWLARMPDITDTQGRLIQLLPKVLMWVQEATFLSYKSNMHSTYGSGLLDYVTFLLRHGIPKGSWLPLSTSLARAWITDQVGEVGWLAMKNTIARVHAWEAINGFERQIPKKVLDALLRATDNFMPIKRKPRVPLHAEVIERMHSLVDQLSTFDIVFFACLTTTFWCTSCLGEFTLQTQNSFNLQYHITPVQIEQCSVR